SNGRGEVAFGVVDRGAALEDEAGAVRGGEIGGDLTRIHERDRGRHEWSEVGSLGAAEAHGERNAEGSGPRISAKRLTVAHLAFDGGGADVRRVRIGEAGTGEAKIAADRRHKTGTASVAANVGGAGGGLHRGRGPDRKDAGERVAVET